MRHPFVDSPVLWYYLLLTRLLHIVDMKFLVLIAAALASVTPSIAAPSKDLVVPILQYVGDVIPNSYIVKLKDGASKDAHLSWLTSTLGSVVNITHNEWSPSVLNGYSGKSNHLYDALGITAGHLSHFCTQASSSRLLSPPFAPEAMWSTSRKTE